MTTRAARTLLAAALLVALLPLGAMAGVGAGASATQVWTENIFGTEPSPSDGITDGRGWVAWSPNPSWRFAANGRRLNFRDNPDLNHGYLTLSAETIPGARSAPDWPMSSWRASSISPSWTSSIDSGAAASK